MQLFDAFVRPLVQTHTGLVYVDARRFYESKRPKIDLIFEMIRQAALVIVELSTKNPNVFLELGFALACNKRVLIICDEAAWKSTWRRAPPFDLQGREVLIYSDNQDLKVRLGASIAAALHQSHLVSVSWIPENRRCHVRSATEMSLVGGSLVMSDRAVQFPFTVEYCVKVEAGSMNPDVRLYIVPGSQDYPRIICIFPWEGSEIDPDKAECHLDWFASEKDEDQYRLQQVSVCEKSKLMSAPWRVFVRFGQPNLVFESPIFAPNVERLFVSTNGLLQRGLPMQNGFRIGFSAHDTVLVSDIAIHQVNLC